MNRHSILFLALGVLILFCCSGIEKGGKTIGWKFSEEILLEDVNPISIVSQRDFLWLSDVDNNRMVKIGHDGKIIEKIDGFQRPMHIDMIKDKIYIPEFSSDSIRILGNENITNYLLKVKTDGAGGVSVDGNAIAVADFYNHRIILQQDDKVTIIGKEGHNDGDLYYPTDVDIHNSLVYVADAYNNRIQVFDFHGKYVRMIGWNEGINVAIGLKVTDNQVIVTDFEGNRVLVYNLNGKLLQILADQFNKPTDVDVHNKTMYVVNYKGQSIHIYHLNLNMNRNRE